MADETETALQRNPYPDELKALHKALAQAQGEFPPIARSSTVDTGTYKFSYAPLDVIIAAVRPVLAKHGLAIIQRLETAGNGPAIRTELLHAEGGRIAASFPLGELPGQVQQLGSRLTYLRRYALCSMLCIAAEDDDDGHRSSTAAKASQTQSRDADDGGASPSTSGEASPFQPPDLKPGPASEDLTSPQRKKIFAIRTKLIDAGALTDQQFEQRMLDSFGVDSVSGLTKDQASKLITWLLAAEDALEGGDAQ